MDNKDYIKLWSNDTKRREFIAEYHNTADEVIEESKLGLKFFITVLPNGNKIVVLEHLATNWAVACDAAVASEVIRTKYYYQTEDFFVPSSVSDSFISDKLKDLKIELQQGKWENYK